MIYVYDRAWPPLQRLLAQKFIRGHLGSQGSKRSKTKKRYFSYGLQRLITRFMYMHQLDPPTQKLSDEKFIRAIRGHWGQKVILVKKCYNSSMLHNMTIRLIHVHQLETLHLCYRAKCQSGVISNVMKASLFLSVKIYLIQLNIRLQYFFSQRSREPYCGTGILFLNF